MPKTSRYLLGFIFAASLGLLAACRTYGESHEIEVPSPKAETNLVNESTNQAVLQKVLGDLTRDYPENRYEVCTLFKDDVTDFNAVKANLEKIKSQELVDGFILTAVIPSIQYFGYLGSEQVLLSEISDKKRRTRLPVSEQGNPALDELMAILDSKCGVKDARP